MSSNIYFGLDPLSWKIRFSCSDSEDSFYIYMNSLELDDLISLGENVKQVVNGEKELYESENETGKVHIEKDRTTIESYISGFYPSNLRTKYFLGLITYVLIYYEILEDDSVLDECPSINNYAYSVLADRLLPGNALTTLKKK